MLAPYRFEYHLGLMEKQVKMLLELADAEPRSEAEFVLVRRSRLRELVAALESEVGVMKLGLERLKNKTTALRVIVERWETRKKSNE